jgi:lipopolysaccharide biosynthesis regulator YciM
MMFFISHILFPVSSAALLSGWVLTHWFKKRRPQPFTLSDNYLKGLNFLLNEEPDKAIDVFIKMLEVDSETVETHLALGNLFCKRGEVNRAIRIHQNLIARPTLPNNQRAQALLALANDYLTAGVLDRAETLFCEVLETGEYQLDGLRQLLNIYEQVHEWNKAISIAKKLYKMGSPAATKCIAHYYCEIAEIHLSKKALNAAENALKLALSTDETCVRANLILAKLNMTRQHYKQAIRQLKAIKDQNADYLSEAILPLVTAFRALREEKALITYLRKLLKIYPGLPIPIMLAQQIRAWKGEKLATEFVIGYLRKNPSIQGLQCLVELHWHAASDTIKQDLAILHKLTQKLLDKHPPYRCKHCGFSTKALRWLCPTCRQWDTIKPTHLLDQS